MKNLKNLFTLVVTAMTLTNCSKEQFVSDYGLSGNGYKVQVGVPGMGQSRTVIGEHRQSNGQYPTYWQEDDRIYISSKDGKTNAEMNLQSISDDGQYAYFYGYLLGSQSDLEYAVYPIPDKDGKISLGTHEWESTDIPMIATYGEDKNYVSFKNTVGVVRLVINNFPGGNVEVTGEGISGVAEVAGPDSNGLFYLDWTADDNNKITITNVPQDNQQVIYVPIITEEVLTKVNEQTIAALEDREITVKLDNGASITGKVKVAIAQVSASETTSFLELTYHAKTNALTEAWDGEASETEIDFTAKTVELHNAADLKAFADYVNEGNGMIGQTVKLLNDIDLNNKEWNPIGNGEKSFKGVFDGGNYTIKNLNVEDDTAGLFAVLWGAEIKNLILSNVKVNGDKAGNLAAVVNGNNYATTVISNVTVNNSNEEKLVGTVYGTTKANPLLRINGVYYVDKQSVLENTFKGTDGELKIELTAGEYVLPYASNRAISLIGQSKEAVINMSQTAHNGEQYEGSNLSFENVTLRGVGYNGQQNGYVQSASETYTNCTFETYYMFAGDMVKVQGCTLNNGIGKGSNGSETKQHIWTGSASEIEFDGCTFNLDEEGVKVLTVGNKENNRKVTFTGCDFNTEAKNKAVFRLDSRKSTESTYIIEINSCRKSEGFEKWIEEKQDGSDSKYEVIFDGIEVYVTTSGELKVVEETTL